MQTKFYRGKKTNVGLLIRGQAIPFGGGNFWGPAIFQIGGEKKRGGGFRRGGGGTISSRGGGGGDSSILPFTKNPCKKTFFNGSGTGGGRGHLKFFFSIWRPPVCFFRGPLESICFSFSILGFRKTPAQRRKSEPADQKSFFEGAFNSCPQLKKKGGGTFFPARAGGRGGTGGAPGARHVTGKKKPFRAAGDSPGVSRCGGFVFRAPPKPPKFLGPNFQKVCFRKG